MASVSDQFLYTDIPGQSDEYVDFDQFLDFPPANDDDYSASNSISPEMALPYNADVLCNDLPDFSQTAFPDLASYDMSQEPYSAHRPADMGWIPEPTPVFDEAMFQGYQPYGASLDFRQMVEAQAAADPRMASAKEKRREAAIALHLQRLCDATALELDMSSDSSTSFSSPNLSDSMCESFSPQPASASLESTPVPTPTHAHGGMELVLDLNMNATANLPKKQKPRSQAQKENYIKARKYGACEKHKKQHKRCNCLEKAAVRAGENEVPANVAFRERPNQPALPMPTLSDSRSSGVPGQVSSLRSPTLLPTAKVMKKLDSTNSSRCCSAQSTSTQQQYIKTRTAYTGSVPGHDPRLNTTAVRQTGQDGNHTGSASGHIPSGIVQFIEPARMPLAQPRPRLAKLGSVPTNSGLGAANKAPSQTSPRTTRLETRLLDLGVPGMGLKRRVMEEASSSSALANQPHTPMGVRNPGGSNQQPVTPEGSRHALAVTSTGARSDGIVSSGVGSTGLFGPDGSIVRLPTAQIGGVSSKTVLSTAATWKSFLASASWLEKLIYTGLAHAGKQLMSARKGLRLCRIRAI